MNYLYGDSTPFPLDENFLETLVGLTKVAVGLLRAESEIVVAKQALANLAETVEREDKRLEDLLSAVISLIEQQDPQGSRLLSETAEALTNASLGVIERAREHLAASKSAAGRDNQSIIEAQRAALPRILEQFLLEHGLPKSSWALSWRMELGKTPRAAAQALAISPCGIDALFQLSLPPEHRWSQPIKVGDIVAHASFALPKGRHLLSGAGRKESVALGRHFVTAAELSLGRQSLVLQRRLKEDAQGFELTWQPEHGELVVQPFGKTGKLEGPVTLEQEEAPGIAALFAAIAKDLQPLVRRRRELKSVSFNEIPVAELESPAELARVLIASVAPLLREIVQRSSSSNELALKRDLGGRRREELFVPVAELTDRINTLPEDYRRFFAPFGLPLLQAPSRIVEPSSEDAAADEQSALEPASAAEEPGAGTEAAAAADQS